MLNCCYEVIKYYKKKKNNNQNVIVAGVLGIHFLSSNYE